MEAYICMSFTGQRTSADIVQTRAAHRYLRSFVDTRIDSPGLGFLRLGSLQAELDSACSARLREAEAAQAAMAEVEAAAAQRSAEEQEQLQVGAPVCLSVC